ncbi:hypothetical protein BC835DRAFT_1419689 [Cytidiella melzeri]|nr:hypothetical protein BC835DRAFT_1419689 [Cytidiella melzeri]
MSAHTTPLKQSTAGLMDRHLRTQPDLEEAEESSKLGWEAFMKEVRLFRMEKGKFVAVLPTQTPQPGHKYLPSVGTTIYNWSGEPSFALGHNDSAYVFRGDVCSLGVGAEYDARREAHGEGSRDQTQGLDARRLFMAEGQPAYSFTDLGGRYEIRPPRPTPTGCRTTPDQGWWGSKDSFEEPDVDETTLEQIFHELIDVGQCEQS